MMWILLFDRSIYYLMIRYSKEFYFVLIYPNKTPTYSEEQFEKPQYPDMIMTKWPWDMNVQIS